MINKHYAMKNNTENSIYLKMKHLKQTPKTIEAKASKIKTP